VIPGDLSDCSSVCIPIWAINRGRPSFVLDPAIELHIFAQALHCAQPELILISRRGVRTLESRCDLELLFLKVFKPEGVALPERTTGRLPPLLIAQRRVALGEGGNFRQRLIAVVVVGTSVDLLAPDLVTRFTVPPGLRPVSGEDWVCSENSSTESIERVIPAMPFTPPWLTAAMLCQRSLYLQSTSRLRYAATARLDPLARP
jgi:hypothetical protein